MDISVVICSYNRSADLARVLTSLERSTIRPDFSWEVVVVDNNSSDDTSVVAHDFVNRHTVPLRYLFEGRQGKAHALNTGISAAQGKTIAFVDDDVIVSENWIDSIAEEFDIDLELAGLGGRVELYDKRDKPLAIRTSKERTILSQANFNPGFIPILGCNWAFRRSVFEGVGQFDTCLGPGAVTRATAEDVDFLYRVLAQNLKIAYSPDVVVYHNHGRREERLVEACRQTYIIGRGAFYYKHVSAGDRSVRRHAFREMRSIVRTIKANPLSADTMVSVWQWLRWLVTGALRYRRCYRSDL